MNQTINDLSRIKWRCRRGTKELDFLLLSYFNQRYKAAAEEDQRIFLDLLELQDPKLIEYFAEPKEIKDTGMQRIISEILGSTEGYLIK